MTTLCMADYCPPKVTEPRAAVIRDAINDWTRPMDLTPDQKHACVAVALTQHRNGASPASAIAYGKTHAQHLAGRTVWHRRPAPMGDAA